MPKGAGEEPSPGRTYDKSLLLSYAAALKRAAEEEQPSVGREVSLTARADEGSTKEFSNADRKQQRSFLKDAKAARRSNSGLLGDGDEQQQVARNISLSAATTPSGRDTMADPAMMAYLHSMYAMSQMAAYGAMAAGYTTVMLRNIPNRYTREMLVKRLDESYKGQYDFVYLPIDFESACNVGYVFINFRTPYSASNFLAEFHNADAKSVLPRFSSKKVCEVSYARVQGLEANIANLRDEEFVEKLAEKPEWQPLFLDAAGATIPFDKVIRGKKAKGGKTPKGGGMTPLAGSGGDFAMPGQSGRPTLPLKTATPSMSPATFSSVLPAASGETMLAVRGVPLTVTRPELVEFLNENVAKLFDFVFMPPDANFSGNKGVFFINFRDKEKTADFIKTFHEKNIVDIKQFKPVEGGWPKLLAEPAKVGIVQANIIRAQAPPPPGEEGVQRSNWQPLLFAPDGDSSTFPTIVSEGKKKGDKTPTPGPTPKDSGKTPHTGAVESSFGPMTAATPSASPTTMSSVLPEASSETMLAVRGVPLTLTRPELVEFLKETVPKLFDFVFMPPDANFSGNKGVFFINFKDKEKTADFIKNFHEKKVADIPKFVPVEGGFEKLWVEPAKVGIVQANIIRAQATPPPEEQGVDRSKWQPMLFAPDGLSLTFPVIASEGKKKGDKTPKGDMTPTPAAKGYGVTPLGGLMMPQWTESPFGPMPMLPLMPPMMTATPSAFPAVASEGKKRGGKTPSPAVTTSPATFSSVLPAATSDTMLAVRGVPPPTTRADLLAFLNESVPKLFDFVFMPPDASFTSNKGICFINFKDKEKAADFIKAFHEKDVVDVKQFKPVEGGWPKLLAEPAKIGIVQANIIRAQSSPPPEEASVDRSEWQPLLFAADGGSSAFPTIASESKKKGDKTPGRTPKDGGETPLMGPMESFTPFGPMMTATPSMSRKANSGKAPTPKGGNLTPLAGGVGSFMVPPPFTPMMPSMTPKASSMPSTPLSSIMPSASGETMLFVRGVPITMERAELVELLSEKYSRAFDFVFLPPDMKFSGNKGIFFINFRMKQYIDEFRKGFQEKKVAECFPKFAAGEGDEGKLCSVEPANLDIVESIICRLQTAPPPATPSVDRTKWQPLLFSPDGEHLAFPLIASPGGTRKPKAPKTAKTPKATPAAADAPAEAAEAESQPEAPAAEPAAAPEATPAAADALAEGATPKAKGKKTPKGKGKDKGAGWGGGKGYPTLGMDMYSPAPFGFMPPSPFGFMPGFPYGMPPMSPMDAPWYAPQPRANNKGRGKGALNAAGAGGDPSKLNSEDRKKSLKKQVDFYFSADNLCKDVFLRQNMDQDGYCKLELIANFNLVKKKYMASVSDLANAVVNSTSVELNDDKTKVRLKNVDERQKWRL